MNGCTREGWVKEGRGELELKLKSKVKAKFEIADEDVQVRNFDSSALRL